MTMMLTLLKNVRERDAHVKAGGWHDDALKGTYVGSRADGYAGLTVGIVGLGRIGSRLAELLRPWRVRIVANDPFIDPAHFEDCGATSVDLATLLGSADVVSLHVPLNRQTRHLIGPDQFGRMRKTAILVNTSRGAVIDQTALEVALRSGDIRAAALDVFEQEPLPQESPLRELGDRVLLSPHIAGSNWGAGWEKPGVAWATQAVLAALRGELPEYVYNREVVEKWRARFGGNGTLSRP
jgi:phosphoglycerate dehydrogenase-like enzyme